MFGKDDQGIEMRCRVPDESRVLGKGFNVAFVTGVKENGTATGPVPISVIDQVTLLEKSILDEIEMINLKRKDP